MKVTCEPNCTSISEKENGKIFFGQIMAIPAIVCNTPKSLRMFLQICNDHFFCTIAVLSKVFHDSAFFGHCADLLDWSLVR